MNNDFTTPGMALKWAQFSGDFNPIHFDAVQAAKAGSDRPIVHGMLALLQVKHETIRALHASQPTPGWSRFKAMFRSPIPQNSSVDLLLREKNNSVRFVLEGEGNEYSRGIHETTSAPIALQLNSPPDFILDDAFVLAQFEKFNDLGNVADAWIFLDALVFGKFLEQRFKQLADMPKDIVAVQVSHCVECDANQIQICFLNKDSLPCIGYTIAKEDRSEQLNFESGIAQLDVFANSDLVMRIEIGLLAKAVIS